KDRRRHRHGTRTLELEQNLLTRKHSPEHEFGAERTGTHHGGRRPENPRQDVPAGDGGSGFGLERPSVIHRRTVYRLPIYRQPYEQTSLRASGGRASGAGDSKRQRGQKAAWRRAVSSRG